MKKYRRIFVIALIVLSFPVISYGAIYGGSRTIDSNKFVEVYADSSVATNSYGSLLSNAYMQWRDISSNMRGVIGASQNSYNCDVAYVTDSAISGKLGMCASYKRVFGIVQSVSMGLDYDFCRLYFYKNQIDASRLSDIGKTVVMAHELGHTQKIDHTNEDTHVLSMMWDDINYCCDSVSQYDRNQIISKWGN